MFGPLGRVALMLDMLSDPPVDPSTFDLRWGQTTPQRDCVDYRDWR